jgi:hypothetical protein
MTPVQNTICGVIASIILFGITCWMISLHLDVRGIQFLIDYMAISTCLMMVFTGLSIPTGTEKGDPVNLTGTLD